MPEAETKQTAQQFEQSISDLIPLTARNRYRASLCGALSVHVTDAQMLSCLRMSLHYTPISDELREYLLVRIGQFEKEAR